MDCQTHVKLYDKVHMNMDIPRPNLLVNLIKEHELTIKSVPRK